MTGAWGTLIEVSVGAGVGVAVGAGVGVAVGAVVGVAVGAVVGVAVGAVVGVAAGAVVGVAEDVAVGVVVGVAVGVAVGAGVGVAVGASVGLGVGVAGKSAASPGQVRAFISAMLLKPSPSESKFSTAANAASMPRPIWPLTAWPYGLRALVSPETWQGSQLASLVLVRLYLLTKAVL
jgi:hypothetical protein